MKRTIVVTVNNMKFDLGVMALYLGAMCILCVIAPIIKKITGYDKNINK